MAVTPDCFLSFCFLSRAVSSCLTYAIVLSVHVRRYTQHKFNLLREESEGFAKLITTLIDAATGTSSSGTYTHMHVPYTRTYIHCATHGESTHSASSSTQYLRTTHSRFFVLFPLRAKTITHNTCTHKQAPLCTRSRLMLLLDSTRRSSIWMSVFSSSCVCTHFLYMLYSSFSRSHICSLLSVADRLSEQVQSLMGFFNLDPNRVCDLVLEVMENYPSHHGQCHSNLQYL